MHTALAVNAGDGRPLWTNAHGGEVIAATEQLVLVAQAGDDLPRRQLIAVDATPGQARWRTSADLAATWPTSAVLVNGDFITVFHENDVTQLRTSDGAKLWRVSVDDQHYVSPMFASATTVFAVVTRRPYQSPICFSACGQRLVALDAATGVTRWQREI